MISILHMTIDTFQFYKKIGTNALFIGPFNEACHLYIDTQTTIAKTLVSTYYNLSSNNLRYLGSFDPPSVPRN